MSRRRRARAVGVLLLAIVAAGCSSLGYYAQAARGQLQLLARREPIERVVARAETPDELRETLRLVQSIRDYASRELGLPDNASYRSYADIGRPYVVWNLFAAPEFSVEPLRWCFPFVGCLNYRGYFQQAKAQREAQRLALAGNDVYVGGIAAYSTLGHFADPFLSSMVRMDRASMAGLLFHELAHQRAYVRDDTELNESFASLVEEEGVRRWLAGAGDEAAFARWRTQRERHDDFVALIAAARARLRDLYAGELAADATRTRKAQELERLRADYEALKVGWGGYAGYDAWFTSALNNAGLSSVTTYTRLVPALRVLLREANDDLPAFYAAVAALGALAPAERAHRLERLLARSRAPAAVVHSSILSSAASAQTGTLPASVVLHAEAGSPR